MATMKVMSAAGHETITYDETDAKQVDETRTRFNEIMSHGWVNAYDTTTKPGEPVRSFPSEATSILIVPQIAGG